MMKRRPIELHRCEGPVPSTYREMNPTRMKYDLDYVETKVHVADHKLSSFAREAARDVFGKNMPHPSADGFVDKVPGEVAAARKTQRYRRRSRRDSLEDMFDALARRLVQFGRQHK